MNQKLLAFSAALALAAVIAWWLVPRSGSSSRKPSVQSPPATSQAGVSQQGAPPQPVAEDPAARLEDVAGKLAAAVDVAECRRLFAELRTYLDSMSPEVASQEVQSFLATGRDAASRLDLTVKPGGALGDASSLRVFLLDFLGQIDRAAAGEVAKQILSMPTSSDEWAVSLRNYAWSDTTPEGETYLRGKARELLQNRAWQKQPSAGYLEAFDVIVHARGFDLTPQLTELVRDKESRALGHAAYLTLDRLTLTDPAAALAPLAAQPELMAGREQTRANFFARADVRDPQQKALLERYLLDPRRSAEELQTFAGIFPNANYMISHNLLTTSLTPAHAELAVRDQAALKVLDSWLADPRFAPVAPRLQAARARLNEFVRQAAAP